MNITLYGMGISNYTSMVRHALAEKGIAHEFVAVRPSQEPEMLAKSPMGKVPFLQTPQGFLSETDAILDFLEESCPQVPLLPKDPFARARVRQIMKVQELYVETPIHNLVGVIFGRELPAHVRQESQPAARKGLAALGRLVELQPWVAGADFTLADIFLYYSFLMGNRLAGVVYQWDMLQEVPGLPAWAQRFSEREVSRTLRPDIEAALEARFAKK